MKDGRRSRSSRGISPTKIKITLIRHYCTRRENDVAGAKLTLHTPKRLFSDAQKEISADISL